MPEAENQASTKSVSPRASPRTADSATLAITGPPTIKLPQEEIDKSVNRLHSSYRKTRELPPLLAKKTLSKEAEENSVRRMYEQAIQQKKRKLEELDRKVVAQSGLAASKKLEDVELTEAVQRLYQKSVELKHIQMQRLSDKYVSPPKSHRLTADSQTAVNERVYAKARAQSSEGKAKLYEKYVLDLLPKVPKRTDAEWKATADRLYVKKS